MNQDYIGFGHATDGKNQRPPVVNKNWWWRFKYNCLQFWRFTRLALWFGYKSMPFVAGAVAGLMAVNIYDNHILHKDQWVELLPKGLVRELQHQSKACYGGAWGLEKNETACTLFIAANKANGGVLQLEGFPKPMASLMTLPKIVNTKLVTVNLLQRIPASPLSRLDRISSNKGSSHFMADASAAVAVFGQSLLKTADALTRPQAAYAAEDDYALGGDYDAPVLVSNDKGGSTCELNKRMHVPVIYRATICRAARLNGLNGNELAAQIKAESGFNPRARSRDRRGRTIAMGIAQITAPTAKAWGVDPWNPEAAIYAMAEHVGRDVRTYMRQGRGRKVALRLARSGYNGGGGAPMHFIKLGLKFIFNPRARRSSWDYETASYLRRIETYERA